MSSKKDMAASVRQRLLNKARAHKRPFAELLQYYCKRPPYDAVAPIAAALFNDRIYRVAGEFGVSVIELRRVCTAPEDYANPIEPSVQGGRKIARAILEAVYLGAVHE